METRLLRYVGPQVARDLRELFAELIDEWVVSDSGGLIYMPEVSDRYEARTDYLQRLEEILEQK